MTQQKNSLLTGFIGKLSNPKGIFNVEHKRAIGSLTAISRVVFVFALLFLGAYFYKLFNLDPATTNHFKLVISDLNILPLYTANRTVFVWMVIYEVLRLLTISVFFFYLSKFLTSLDIADPFKNIRSKEYIVLLAFLSMLFFVVDALGTVHLYYYEDLLAPHNSIRLFHFEYLFLAYFINMFAFIFKRGVDLNNEIDLVI